MAGGIVAIPGAVAAAIIGAMPTRARLALLRSLARPAERRREGLYLVEGARLVIEALNSGAPVVEVLVTDAFAAGEAGAAVADAAAARRVGTERIPERELARVARTRTPQGVVAVVRHEEPDAAALSSPGLFLVLDGVADPGNVGTLVRSADAFGARAVVAGPGTADFENDKTLRAAMGSHFHVALLRVDDLAATLRAARAGGGRVVAAVLDGQDAYRVEPVAPRLFLVLGSEAHGVSEEVLALADDRVTVPCPGRAESLNVAMAGAVLLSRLSRAARSEVP